MCSPAAFELGVLMFGIGATFMVSGYLNLKVIGEISRSTRLKDRNEIAEKLIKTSNRSSSLLSFA